MAGGGWVMAQRRRWPVFSPLVADGLLAAAVAVVTLGGLFGAAYRRQEAVSWPLIALALLGTLPLVARRRQPVLVLVAVESALVLYFVTPSPSTSPNSLALFIALYTVASRAERRTSLQIAVLIGAINVLVSLVGVLLGYPEGAAALFAAIATVVGAWSLGDNVRTRRAYLAQLEERARRLEVEREENARHAVRDERARIARELHDVVAHHVSAIAVQAGAAAEIVERDPLRAREALRSIQGSSRQALAEMRALLSVLRGDDEPGTDRLPQPGLAQLESLIAQSRAVGLPMTLRVEGFPRPLPEALDLSAYRIVQEALTNSRKHAGLARASVLVRYGEEALELEIRDDGRGTTRPSPGTNEGRGLIGMRERVALFHGDLTTGVVADGGFAVRVRLPLE